MAGCQTTRHASCACCDGDGFGRSRNPRLYSGGQCPHRAGWLGSRGPCSRTNAAGAAAGRRPGSTSISPNSTTPTSTICSAICRILNSTQPTRRPRPPRFPSACSAISGNWARTAWDGRCQGREFFPQAHGARTRAMVFTDPPYNVNSKRSRPRQNQTSRVHPRLRRNVSHANSPGS